MVTRHHPWGDHARSIVLNLSGVSAVTLRLINFEEQSHKTVFINHTRFEERIEPKRNRTEVQPNALPVGQTANTSRLYSLCHVSPWQHSITRLAPGMRVNTRFVLSYACAHHWEASFFEAVPLVGFMYLVFTCMPGESYRRRLRSLLL